MVIICFFHKYNELKNTVTRAIRKAKVADFNTNTNNLLRNIKQFHANLKLIMLLNLGKKGMTSAALTPLNLTFF